LEEALQQQRGVLLLGAHFSTLDLGGLLFSFYCETLDCIYRPHNNPLMDYIIAKKRSQFCHVIERKNFRKVLRSMKSNRCVWYAPDQDFGKKNAVFVPFFGQQAATITATTKLIAMNQSPILMLSHHRNADNGGYTVTINPVENFPSGDEVKDAAIVNQAIEHEIRKAPEQYMWIHRRFKTQPDGRKKLYQREIR
jgi:KDO2-lipid IV(A) lauroyltransferase